MEDKTKNESNELDALTVRYNACLQKRNREGAPLGTDIEMDAKVIRLGLNRLSDEETKSGPRLKLLSGGKDKTDASNSR
jgi:hypothetical protein